MVYYRRKNWPKPRGVVNLNQRTIMPDLPELRFSSIRAHLGSQTKGFEELVAQVFRLDTQNQGQYHRIEGAGGDGGVEAYTVRPDGSKIGVQSKFFEKVKAPQWKQIEKSVHAAIANHPELAEYRIAVPIDRNGTQIKTWNNKVTTWNRYATSQGFTRPIQFVWLGTSELIGELLKPACAQAQVYWFGLPQFTDEWMDRVFRLALENLDKRYSPAEHVNTEAGRELQAFAHSPSVGAQLKRQFLQVLTAWGDLHADIGKSSAFSFNRSQMDKLMEAVTAFKGLSWPERSLPSLRNAATAATAIRDIWLPLHVEIEKENEKAKAKDPHIPSYYQTGPHDHLLYLSEKFFRQIENWHQLTSKFRCADSSKVLLYGDAGNGKSHVLAAVVHEARKRKQPALLLLGEQFSEQTPLTSQIASVTDWGSTPDTLLTALNQSALAFGAHALLLIDAINETAVQNLWFSKIGALNAKLADYRLIKYAGARRILFLVDRANLGRQATAEFQQFVTPDTGRKFTELYNVQHLTSNQLDSVSRVTMCTIQRLYSMLRGEELPEDADEISTYEIDAADGRAKEVAYNPNIPIETFDFIVTDECHRSIYGLWRQVLEYFDAFIIGLTATPSKQTIGFFHQNLVMEYNHERAVADGVNVGYEVYRIKTDVTERGGLVEKGFYVDKRSKETRATRWARLDEDLVYEGRDLDRSVVVKSQIRTVLEAFKAALFTELFPGRTLVPKTLIFAKDDSHAEDIVHIVREVFGKGNDFAKKITYKSYNAETKRYEKSETLIQEFRTSPQLRIAVTVDMIATGTDIKPLECLLFLRDVRSRSYFEQMKGRGTRVLTPTDLQAVSGADARAKTGFIIVDAVGVCESDKTDSRPLERKRTVAFKDLLLGVAMGKRDEDTLTTLAGRLARLDREITGEQRKQVEEMGGKPLAQLSSSLLRAIDPDVIAEKATGKPGASPDEVAPALMEKTRQGLITETCKPFDRPALRDFLTQAKQEAEQIIDVTTIDTITHQGFDAAARQKAASLVKTFRDYVEQHHAEIAALQILYSRPYRQRLTEPMLKELERKLRDANATWNEETLWQAFAATEPGKVKGRSVVNRFADLVPLVRFALEQQPVLKPFAISVQARFESWLAEKTKAGTEFTADQRAWLDLIRDHVATSLSIEPDDFDYAPFNQRGGLGKAHQLFGPQLPSLLEELNTLLVA
jgi:type I restriction enzyme R subunit